MDPQHFDAMARTLCAASTRRRLSLILGGLTAGGSLSLGAIEQAAGKQKKNKKKKKKRQKDTCPKGCGAGICCDGACVMETIDRNNCGACGNVCGAAQYCLNGKCAPCEQPRAVCPIAGVEFCVDVKTDRENCGACSVSCPRDPRNPQRDEVCQDGKCVCTGVTCSNGRCCPAGYTVCVNGGDGCCPTNYHSCGNGECCPNGYTCGGTCGQGCCRP